MIVGGETESTDQSQARKVNDWASSCQDPDKRAKAELLFTKLNHIHGILTDPHKRAIYDTLGEKGLKEQVKYTILAK